MSQVVADTLGRVSAQSPEPAHAATAPTSRFQRLDHAAVRRSAANLQRRVEARFPERSLWEVGAELVALVDEVGSDEGDSRRRVRAARVASRVGMVLVLLFFGGAIGMAATEIAASPDSLTVLDWLPLIETIINDVVFGGIAVFFLYTVPERMERARVLRVLHRLRSLAHVIDMHQLTKVPERLHQGSRDDGGLGLTRDEFTIYLHQCSEMLSLVGKTAALFGEETTDGEILDAVGGIETLTSDMARKVWQKIALIPADENHG